MRWSSSCRSLNVTFAPSVHCASCGGEAPSLTSLRFPAASLRDSKSSLSQSTLGLALERGFGSQTTLSGSEYRPAVEELEEAINLSNMATPKMGKRLHIPVVRIHDAQVRRKNGKKNGFPRGNYMVDASRCFSICFQDACSRSPSIISLKTAEHFAIELKKSGGSLGISVAVSGLFSSLCCSKICPSDTE